MNQRRGRPAQDQFKLLCSTAGITCNPSLEDDHGWDFHVEIPMTAEVGAPADRWPPPRSVFVQIKSTAGMRRRMDMKVSNALKLAKKSAPCIIVLFHERTEGQRIYARLFGEKDMERALKRARQLSAEDRAVNKAKLTFTFPEEEEHTTDLLDWMMGCVQGLAPDYDHTKTELADRIGYGDRNYQANITFSGSRGLDDLVDLQLGLKDGLEASRIEVFDMRFGIKVPVPAMSDSDGGIFRMQPEKDIECDVALETEDHIISLRSKARISSLKGSSPEDLQLSFLNELFILVVSQDAFSINVRNASSTKLPLWQLEHLARMLAWHEQDVLVRVTGDVPDMELRMKVKGEGRQSLDRSVGIAIGNLRDLASRSALEEIRLSLSEVLAKYQELMFYHGVLSDTQMSMKACSNGLDFDYAGLRNLLGFVDVEVGEYTFLTLFDAGITAHLDESGQLEVELRPRNSRDFIVDKGRETVRAKGQAIHDQYSAEYGDEWLSIGSLNELISS